MEEFVFTNQKDFLTLGSTRGSSYVFEYNPFTGAVKGWNEC